MSRVKPNYFFIPLFVIITASAASYFAETGRAWYQTINLPDWTPSASLMVLAWTIIFVLSSISLLIIWNKHSEEKKFKIVIGLFVINAILIVGWNILFFSHQQLGLAFFLAVLLIANLSLLIFFIWRLSPLAACLLVPYSLYLLFSTVLAINVWMLN
ncbi:MAG: tryptophan-rich sensory protein [Ignavibacteriaceae bacterium]|nr:tryptophan-rich sensory protein [Ignavibacteriaceae bacterium]